MILTYKNTGETPLQALERVRMENGIALETPMTYAGRLDPLVEGLLVILVGEECKTKDDYTNLDKVYEFEILSGFSTDTYDLLGLVTAHAFGAQIDIELVKKYLEENKKVVTQKYPPYSSKTVDGKQLHQHAREGSHPEVMHEVELKAWEFLGERTLTGTEVLKSIKGRISLVSGDFRQEEILKTWRDVFVAAPDQTFQITKWKVTVSSGFYIRQLVEDIGTHCGVPTVTFHIKRTQIGNWTDESAILTA